MSVASMAATIRWPSITAFGRTPKASPRSTRSATPRAAALPDSMAIPRLARRSDRMSLTPSPTIAT